MLRELILTTFRAIERGDASTARDLHGSWHGFRELARRYGQPQSVKAAMNTRGFSGGPVRPPLRPLGGAELAAVYQMIELLARDARTGLSGRKTTRDPVALA